MGSDFWWFETWGRYAESFASHENIQQGWWHQTSFKSGAINQAISAHPYLCRSNTDYEVRNSLAKTCMLKTWKTRLMLKCDDKIKQRKWKRKELTRTRWNPLDADPPEGEHCRMMINVEERELIILFPEDEEEGVAELQDFREVVPPNSVHNL